MELGFQSGRRAHIVPNRADTQPPPASPFAPLKAIGAGPTPAMSTHPIPLLMEEAEDKYRKKLASQSRSLSAAVAEYRRRYRRPPPRGFDAWWKFCQTYDVKMVDEYDGLMEDLRPFFDLSGEEFRRRAQQAGMLPSVDLVRVRGGVAEVVNVNPQFRDSEVSARARGLRSMMGKFLKTLPDMDLPVNAKAEGRVLVPWEHRVYPNMTKTDSSDGVESMLGGPFKPDWSEDGNVWEAWRRTCTPQSAARRLHASLRPLFAGRPKNYFKAGQIQGSGAYGDDFTFAKTTSASLDFCEVPHAHYTQGHFFSDWRSIPVLYPILSPAKAKGFMDIRIPSHYYYGSTKRYTYGWDPVNLELKEVDPMEVPWEEKKDKIFWRGATTGGGSHPPGFAPMYQRHRFLRMASDAAADTTLVVYPVPGSNGFSTTEVPVGELNEEVMDAAFVKAVSAASYPGGLKALMAAHRFGDSVPLGWHWRYKYLIDLDGMSYSGRFMSFLASDSVPIKSTVYEEFFTDWIQPWYATIAGSKISEIDIP